MGVIHVGIEGRQPILTDDRGDGDSHDTQCEDRGYASTRRPITHEEHRQASHRGHNSDEGPDGRQ
jgi:hypothetical protein